MPDTTPSRPLIGLRREDKNRWERRTPLTPDHVAELVKQGIAVRVQPSTLRAFPEADYAAAGAEIDEDLSPCPLIFGVKEIPIPVYERDHSYVFFSHTVKGQPYNMPMLKTMLDRGCGLVDYEKIARANGKRLVFFGKHAGLAGAVETLRALGIRLKNQGFDTPFAAIGSALDYPTVADAQAAIAEAGARLREQGVPEALRPLTFGVAGYGNVASGVFEMLAPLDLKSVAPEDLASIPADSEDLHLVVFKEQHLAQRKDKASFDLQEYFASPEHYEGVFAPHCEHLTVLFNCIYWEERYPVLFTKDDLRAWYADPQNPPKMQVIGDITCDIEGSVPCTTHATYPDAPNYVWDPATGTTTPGEAGNGPVIMAIDNLPCEFPRDASQDFGDALLPFVAAMARTDWHGDLQTSGLPREIADAVVAWHGRLTPRYSYLTDALAEHAASE